MEAAGVALVANQHGTPFICVKAVTDIVGANTGHNDFHHNLETSMAALCQQLPRILSCAVRLNDAMVPDREAAVAPAVVAQDGTELPAKQPRCVIARSRK